MNGQGKRNFLRYVGYGLAVLVMYLVQFTPMMVSIQSAYFSPLLILVLCFASHENDKRTMVFSMICGMLVDMNSLCPPGYHAIIYTAFGLSVCLMYEFYFQRRLRTALLLSIIPLILNSLCEWIVGTGLCEGAWYLYTVFYLPQAVYSFVILIPVYALFTVIYGFKNKYRKPRGVVPEKLEAVRRKYDRKKKRRENANRRAQNGIRKVKVRNR